MITTVHLPCPRCEHCHGPVEGVAIYRKDKYWHSQYPACRLAALTDKRTTPMEPSGTER